jgi:hypothetical protein
MTTVMGTSAGVGLHSIPSLGGEERSGTPVVLDGNEIAAAPDADGIDGEGGEILLAFPFSCDEKKNFVF